MEVVDGGELYEHIVHRRRLSEDDARGVLLQVLEGVEVLHAIGVMHRDLKPENILVVKRWEGNALPKAGPLEVKLTDFGLATEFSESWDCVCARSLNSDQHRGSKQPTKFAGF